MLVKLKDPGKVYYDREQKATLNGKGTFTVKPTLHIRKLIGEGAIVEVVVDNKQSELSEADKAKAAEAKLNDEAKAKAAEAKIKAVEAKVAKLGTTTS